MPRFYLGPLYVTVLTSFAFGQGSTYPYFLKSYAGTFPIGDGGSATSALLYYPYAAIPDASGNLYILDSDNYRIRKVTTDGKIATLAQINIFGYDMKLAGDGSLYVTGSAEVIKISPSGTVKVVAGTGTYGTGGDGGPATSAQLGSVFGIALDTAGNLYMTDVYFPSCRVRMVTADGKIQTIAGTSSYGFNGDNQPATSATLYYPEGIAVDSSGAIYVADAYNYRIRKFTVGGPISTFAGTGSYGQPANGTPAGSRLGFIKGLYLDSSHNLYAVDNSWDVVLKITPGQTLSRVAGNFTAFAAPADGPATSASLLSPENVSVDGSGNLFIVGGDHLVREVNASGILTTVAGRIHFGGDNGPATSALLNQPTGLAMDLQGNVFIADAANYRIRKVAVDGTIMTYAGNGTPGTPTNGTPASSAQIPYIYAMTSDSKGALYLASYYQILKIAPDGTVSVVAGTGSFGNTGDGGPATSATFEGATGIAVDWPAILRRRRQRQPPSHDSGQYRNDHRIRRYGNQGPKRGWRPGHQCAAQPLLSNAPGGRPEGERVYRGWL